MNNARKGNEAAKKGRELAGLQIRLALGEGDSPIHSLAGLRSPKAKGRDVWKLSDRELDEILAGPEP